MSKFYKRVDPANGIEIVREEVRKIDKNTGYEVTEDVLSAVQKISNPDGSFTYMNNGKECSEADYNAYISAAGTIIDHESTIQYQKDQEIIIAGDAQTAVIRAEQKAMRQIIPLVIQMAEAAGMTEETSEELKFLKANKAVIDLEAPKFRKGE